MLQIQTFFFLKLQGSLLNETRTHTTHARAAVPRHYATVYYHTQHPSAIVLFPSDPLTFVLLFSYYEEHFWSRDSP